MSRKSDPFTDFFNALKGKSGANVDDLTAENLSSTENILNLLNNETALNFVLDFAPHMTSHFINPQSVQKVLDCNPKLTDELLTGEIDLFVKEYPEHSDLVHKYLHAYRDEHSMYGIRKFVRSDDFKKALDDPQVKQCLKQLLSSPSFKEKIKQMKKK